PQQLPESQRPRRRRLSRLLRLVEGGDGVLEAIALDKAHGVEGSAVGVAAQAVDGHDARMLQLAGDLRLQKEARPALRLGGVPRLDLLQGDLAMEFLVTGYENLAQATPSVRPQDAKAGDGSGGTADDLGAGGVGIDLRPLRGDMHQAGQHVAI